jgi:hypothetical protein
MKQNNVIWPGTVSAMCHSVSILSKNLKIVKICFPKNGDIKKIYRVSVTTDVYFVCKAAKRSNHAARSNQICQNAFKKKSF